MSTLSPRPPVPRSPRTIAVLRDDGTGELTINGVTQPLKATSVDEARALVLERVSTHAHEDLGGPVRLLASDPDGWWDLAVYPDGHVSELASRPPAPKAVPQRAPSSPRAHGDAARRRTARRAGAFVALLSVIASATAVVLSASDEAPAPAGPPARPAIISQSAASAALVAARRDAAHRASLREARRERAAELRAAHEQAIKDRAAKRRAKARRARVARTAAAKRADARRARRERAKSDASASKPPADAKPRPAAPAPPPARSCGQFDLC
ncbi:MAG: hypothetical protein QOJ63_2019 [Solirubrobacteraceae bacterium]|jgi:hypothetical protein|nr:hypothetical protein [Solirubrobacteraceae bacterium]